MENMTPSEPVKSKKIIQPHELMIGNYLKASLTNEIIEVDWLVIKHVSDGNIQAAGYDNSSVYEPIPLTEQWLREFGFENLGQQHTAAFIRLNNDTTLHVSLTGVAYIRDNISHLELPQFIQYVHQLQNLYFCLSGSQLTRTTGKDGNG